jgi:NTP pyrophosphatase (non-canonical NTP hydrolase)
MSDLPMHLRSFEDGTMSSGTMRGLDAFARYIRTQLDRNFPDMSPDAQVLMLVEEAGEFAGAYRRYSGQARRTGTHADMSAELADVIIGAHVVALYLDIDLSAAIDGKLDVIMKRGWKEPR